MASFRIGSSASVRKSRRWGILGTSNLWYLQERVLDKGSVYLKGENNSANVSIICMPFLRKVSEERLYKPWDDVSC